jgi:hypothetical protein
MEDNEMEMGSHRLCVDADMAFAHTLSLKDQRTLDAGCDVTEAM